MDSTVKNRVHALAGGTATIKAGITAHVYVYNGNYCTTNTVFPSASSACDVAYLTCGAATRGSSLTCQINNLPPGATISKWKFTDGTNTVTTFSTSSSWSGTAVQSGTVSVTVASGGTSSSLSSAWTVNARTGWAFTAVSPVKVANGSGTGQCTGVLPFLSTPTSNSSYFGYYCMAQNWSFGAPAVVSDGPNGGYIYATSASNANGSNPTIFQWERVPDLDNTSTTFYTKQRGHYSASNTNGCILGSNLAAGTQRHESGAVQGHWGFYQNSQNSPSDNLGTTIEGFVRPPSETTTQFSNDLNSALTNAATTIQNAAKVDPYPVNYDQNDMFLGPINTVIYELQLRGLSK